MTLFFLQKISLRIDTPGCLMSRWIPILERAHIWIIVCLGLGICSKPVEVKAQPISPPDPHGVTFEHLSPKEGLLSSKVISVTQDQKGFIWIGSYSGLNRYDGYEMVAYQHAASNPTSLSDNRVEVVYLDRMGTLWVGTWNGLNRFDPLTNTFQSYYFDPADPSSLSNNRIQSILEDGKGNLWIATGDGLCRYDRDREAFARYFHDPTDNTSLSYNIVTVLYLDRQGTFWVGTGLPWDEQVNRGGLNRYDPSRDAFIHYEHQASDPFSLYNNEISALYEDKKGTFWVATWGDGLQSMNREKGTFSPAKQAFSDPNAPGWPQLRTPNGAAGAIKFIHEDIQGICWIGGFAGGLDRYDPVTRSMTRYAYNPNQQNGLSDNSVWAIFEDRQHILWISTWKGLNKVAPEAVPFRLMAADPAQKKGLHNSHVEEVLEDREGTLWAGTWSGLERFDPLTGKTTLFEVGDDLPQKEESEMVLTLFEDRAGYLWVGTLSYGLARFDRQKETFTVYRHEASDPASIGSNIVMAITEDTYGNLWVSGNNGVSKFDRATGQFIPLFDQENTPVQKLVVFALLPEKDGPIWLGAMAGLYQFDPSTGIDTLILAGYLINSILGDGATGLWLGTSENGLLHFEPTTGKIQSFSTSEGMPDNMVCGLIRDAEGRIWISTIQGLAWYDPLSQTVRSFRPSQAPPVYEFYPLSVARSANGDLLFGGNGGIVRFDPKAIHNDPQEARPVIIGLRLFNKQLNIEPFIESETTSNNPAKIKTLAYNQNDLTFEYAGLHFTHPEENTYRYRLDPYEQDWRYVGNQRSAIYPNLPPGKYVFRVQAANPDGVWSKETATFQVTILSPWWKTPWAFLCYGLLILLGVLVVDHFQRRRLVRVERERGHLIEIQLRAEIAESKTLQLKALDEAKANFYANITHEFRTPLTVIMGMIDQISGYEKERTLIRRNSLNLLRLINQLLDLAKLDSGSLKLYLVQNDILIYLQYLTESFYSMAQEKQLRLTFYAEIQELVMDFDEEKIQHIVYNLLSNAIKFTEKGGTVVLHANEVNQEEQPFLQLKVTDTGIGIPDDQLPHIFDRFYQADISDFRKNEGTGIGLALTTELVTLMGGSIAVESTLGKGTQFTLLLPVKREVITTFPTSSHGPSEALVPLVTLASPELTGDEPQEENTEDKPILLIIEDNADVVTYIVGLLANEYHIYTASDGQAGIEKAMEIIPDIIISDVMMPKKNGYEVCASLKNDERTSHIPIVLLTAKATLQDRIEGLRGGADAYLVKPFHKEELFVRLEQLVALRKNIQARYAGKTIFTADAPIQKEPSLDDVFLQKLTAFVQAHLDDSELGVPELCRAVRLSNTQVNRKLKALTDKTPSQFIRSIRLQRSVELLKTTDLNIAEIAYEVGFNDPNYFTRSFSEEFGHPPSEIRK